MFSTPESSPLFGTRICSRKERTMVGMHLPPRSSYLTPHRKSPNRTSIKVLDLLTNRYHVGVIIAASDEGFLIEMPLAARLSAGQRIRFALDDASGLICRRTMLHGTIQHVQINDQGRLRI